MATGTRWSSKFEIKPGSWVFVPTNLTKEYGQDVKKAIEEKWNPPSIYYHLRDGGHVKALSAHLKNDFYIHIDIANFFGCINKSRVTRILKRYWPYNKAREIASLSTVRDPNNTQEVKFILPFGFVQSPIIASACLRNSKLGRYLSEINRDKDTTVSVYMDDIVISSNNWDRLFTILEQIKPISEFSKFPLNPLKEEGPADSITAFNIVLSKGELKLTGKRLSDFMFAHEQTDSLSVKNGIVGYVSTVNKVQAGQISL